MFFVFISNAKTIIYIVKNPVQISVKLEQMKLYYKIFIFL